MKNLAISNLLTIALADWTFMHTNTLVREHAFAYEERHCVREKAYVVHLPTIYLASPG